MSIPTLTADPRILAARDHWQFRGQKRPDFAAEPMEGQESVWDYPRPPRIEDVAATLRVEHAGELVAETRRGKRVLETAGAPTYYFPPDDVMAVIKPESGGSICEWKGVAQPLSIAGVANAGWRYVEMFPEFADLYQWIAFYPSKLDCYVGDERVTPQPGGYYGGWVTANVVGPIKGEPGSGAW